MKQKKKSYIGIDLGGTKMLAAVFSAKFSMLGVSKSKMDMAKGEKAFLQTLKETVGEALEEARLPAKRLAGIGIGCPGIIDRKEGRVVSSPNIRFFKNYRLADKISKLYDVPVVLENDVNTGLFGEHAFGAAKGYDEVLGVFIGTGIGGALMTGGRLYRGASGSAGEVGHVLVDPYGPHCGCGQRGCLEALAGRLAIASEAAVLASRQRAPELFRMTNGDLSNIKSGVLAKAIKAGDSAVEALVRGKARLIGTTLAGIVNVLNPQLLVLGGGVVEAMEKLILEEAEDALRGQAMPDIEKRLKVVAAKLGDYAIVKGAARLIADHLEHKGKKK